MNNCLMELYIGYNFIRDENIFLDKNIFIFNLVNNNKFFMKNNTLHLRQFIIYLAINNNRTTLDIIDKIITDFYKKNKLFHLLCKIQNLPPIIYLEILKMIIVQDCKLVINNLKYQNNLEDNIIPYYNFTKYWLKKWEHVYSWEFINKNRCYKNMLLISKNYDKWLELQFCDLYYYRQNPLNLKIKKSFVNILSYLLRERKNDIEIETFIMNNIDIFIRLNLEQDKIIIKYLWSYIKSYNLRYSMLYDLIKFRFGNTIYKNIYSHKNCYPQLFISSSNSLSNNLKDTCYICMDNFIEYEHIIKCRTCVESVSHIKCSEKFRKCGFCRKIFRLYGFSFFR
jgi:hypothetical protein